MRVRHALGMLRWYWRELTGEAEYDRYLLRHHRAHPGTTPLTRREFECRRTDRLEGNPSARCC